MRGLETELGDIAVDLLGLIGVLWLCNYPRIYWTLCIALLVGWGAFSILVPAWAIFGHYLPNGQILMAMITAPVGAFMIFPWWFIGLPMLKKMLSEGHTGPHTPFEIPTLKGKRKDKP